MFNYRTDEQDSGVLRGSSLAPNPRISGEHPINLAARAGFAYFAAVVVLDVIVGTFGILFIEPSMGELAAVLSEVTIILLASWLICQKLVSRYSVPEAFGPRLFMGTFAYLLILAADMYVALYTPGYSPSDYINGFRETTPLIGLIGQTSVGMLPLIQMRTFATRTGDTA